MSGLSREGPRGSVQCAPTGEQPMTVLIEAALPSDAFMLGEVLGTPGVQIELLSCVPVGLGPMPYCWLTGESDTAAFERNVRRDSRIAALTIQRVVHNPTGDDHDTQTLTSKQREAVRLAFERGYFTVPREVSLTELADELEISRQAFTHRLQRGLYGILAVLFEE